MAVKIGLIVAVLAVAGGVFLATTDTFSKPAATTGPQIGDPGSALPAIGNDWLADFSPGHSRQVTVLRDSLRLADYRVEFSSRIDSNALGWVFRARDSLNFYVAKLEVLRPGPNPTLALAHFAVIDGRDQPAVRRPLAVTARPDTVYKIRFQAIGNHFTTWIQDQQVDDWTDDQIKAGGVGLFAAREERSVLQGKFSVVPLAMKK